MRRGGTAVRDSSSSLTPFLRHTRQRFQVAAALAPVSACRQQSTTPAAPTAPLQERLVSLCKRRGFVFPNSEIYGGLTGSFDFGPLGNNLINSAIILLASILLLIFLLRIVFLFLPIPSGAYPSQERS
jgi:hypothetical protein